MTARVDRIFRHPIKGHSRETILGVALETGKSMPWDRVWAVAHEASEMSGENWEPSRNFSRGSKAPGLMGISSQLDEEREIITLRHPEREDISIHPERDSQRFLEWAGPLVPTNRAQSARVVRPRDRGMSDTDYASVSIGSLSSLKALEEKMGTPLGPERFRMNFWVEGLAPWEEFEWVGKRIRIGTAELEVREPTIRCNATKANPATGKIDADTLGALEDGWGHQHFGVYAVVVSDGTVQVRDGIAPIL